MFSISLKLHKFILTSLSFCIILFNPLVGAYSQGGSYSSEAQNILDSYSGDNLDIFKFSINNILNSDGDIVEKPAGNPSIFGRTDYGSEFFLENELSTAYSIEIPAFVINDLALDSSGEYFPIIKDGTEKLSIDFKDLYDSESGEVITPDMGFVKIINDSASTDLENLSDGEIVEFFVQPTDKYLNQHNKENLFFIDRPIPDNPVVTGDYSDEKETGSSSSNGSEITTSVAPGEEPVTLPSGEVKVYVTTVYVPAPASKFVPTQLVMPILADGDYNYGIEPAAAETFPDDLLVVAIPEEEAAVLSEKVQQLKKAKEAPSNPNHKEDTPPALDPGLEAMIKLELLLNDVKNAPRKILAKTKEAIQKEFPNISKELINLIINLADSEEKFDLMQNPIGFLDNEFLKLSDITELNLLLGKDVPQKDLIKIYNLISYKFSSDLAALGFDTLKNQRVDFSTNINRADQILGQVQLQQDILAIASLFRSDEVDQNSGLLIEPVKTNPDSSTKLFESSSSQKVLNQMKQFSDVINAINSSFNKINAIGSISGDEIPIVEINVQIGESIADALQKKLNEEKRLNKNFRTRSQSSKLEKFDFKMPTQDESLNQAEPLPLLTEAPNISDQELQLVAETTEATNNILNETINRMLGELGDTPVAKSSAQLVSTVTNEIRLKENQEVRQDFIFTNALSSAVRLQEIEDIRAIFQILGIGS